MVAAGAERAPRAENSEFLRRTSMNERDIREVADIARAGVELAKESLLRMEAHEVRCSDRYETIQVLNSETKAALIRIHERIDVINSWRVRAGVAVISVLLSIVGYLLVYGPPYLN